MDKHWTGQLSLVVKKQGAHACARGNATGHCACERRLELPCSAPRSTICASQNANRYVLRRLCMKTVPLPCTACTAQWQCSLQHAHCNKTYSHFAPFFSYPCKEPAHCAYKISSSDVAHTLPLSAMRMSVSLRPQGQRMRMQPTLQCSSSLSFRHLQQQLSVHRPTGTADLPRPGQGPCGLLHRGVLGCVPLCVGEVPQSRRPGGPEARVPGKARPLLQKVHCKMQKNDEI